MAWLWNTRKKVPRRYSFGFLLGVVNIGLFSVPFWGADEVEPAEETDGENVGYSGDELDDEEEGSAGVWIWFWFSFFFFFWMF